MFAHHCMKEGVGALTSSSEPESMTSLCFTFELQISFSPLFLCDL